MGRQVVSVSGNFIPSTAKSYIKHEFVPPILSRILFVFPDSAAIYHMLLSFGYLQMPPDSHSSVPGRRRPGSQTVGTYHIFQCLSLVDEAVRICFVFCT